MGIIEILKNNLDILGIGLGIGLLTALIIYYYNLIFKKDQAKALEPLKDLLIVVLYIVLLFGLDYAYNTFLSNWLGVNINPGDNIRIAEAVIYKDIDKFRESLVYIYIADFMITLMGGFQTHIHAALNPDMSLLGGVSLIKKMGPLMSSLFGKASTDPYKSEVAMNFFSNFLSALQILYAASYGLFIIIAYKYIKLTVISYLPLVMSIFIPISLLLIFLPITRKVGLTIFGIAITLYYLFPVFIIYSDTVLRNMPDFDYRYISSYISPTIVEFLDRSPYQDRKNIGYKYAFVEREKKITSIVKDYFYVQGGNDNTKEPAEDNKIADSEKETMGVILMYSLADAQSVCEKNTDQEVCREFETTNIGDYKSENSLAPVASLYGNVMKYAGIARLSASLKELISVTGFLNTNPLLIILKNIANIAINIATSLIFITQLLPIPVVSDLVYGLFQIPFIPFLVFKTILEVAIIAYKNIIYGSLTIFLDIFLIITGYRAVASIIGAEQRVLGLEKVL